MRRRQGGGDKSFAERAEIFLSFHRGGATGAGCRDRLLVNAVGDITGDEDPRVFAFRQMPNEQIAFRISLEFPLERFRVRIVPDRDENARDRP